MMTRVFLFLGFFLMVGGCGGCDWSDGALDGSQAETLDSCGYQARSADFMVSGSSDESCFDRARAIEGELLDADTLSSGEIIFSFQGTDDELSIDRLQFRPVYESSWRQSVEYHCEPPAAGLIRCKHDDDISLAWDDEFGVSDYAFERMELSVKNCPGLKFTFFTERLPSCSDEVGAVQVGQVRIPGLREL